MTDTTINTTTAEAYRYEVETEFKTGVLTNVYRGNDRERAVSVTNFWDERQSTYLIDKATLSLTDKANRAFDAAIEKLKA